ncbi:AraC family transcriptional regulator [Hymenobacter sp. UV11]|uniref:helix-turn-helix domain-containing protein n=1 Tax=Hymenobacter sp. UV11 TaxID=1849735 RepID=UPI00105D764F|nr:helix-turn-helix domain-containing protein [Hymenobacter sp. UV11]TDN37080.1 transcriptional regulator [Hymenobacter sp. UV11]TFZ62682.1 AraC family transcriptional regulator [Hymenobacter sp. UV11]
MKFVPLEELYTKLASGAGGGQLPPLSKEVGHFNVFRVEDLLPGPTGKSPPAFHRQEFYKISLVRGRSQVEYADKVLDIADRALWFASSRVPYRWLPQDPEQTGYFCIFTEEFLLPAKGTVALVDLPVFQPGGSPVLLVTSAEYARAEAIFEKMKQELASDYTYKYELLRAYLVELIHFGQKLQPAPAQAPTHNAAERVTSLFANLLERQFPLVTPEQTLRLRTATDFADRLAVHVNHLNKVLKETTGHTTTALIGHRVVQEAKLLLKQTTWSVSEIADSLGFTDVAHFCKFFKRHTGLAPGTMRA